MTVGTTLRLGGTSVTTTTEAVALATAECLASGANATGDAETRAALAALLAEVDPREPNAECEDAVRSVPRVNVIVPYRGRARHLLRMAPGIARHLRSQSWRLTVVEDVGCAPINRGTLLNIGFLAGENDSAWSISHDVDLVPDDSLCYLPPAERQVLGMRRKRNFDTYAGGAVALGNADWRRSGGYSNRFVGWGCEDDFLRERLTRHEGLTWNVTPSGWLWTHLDGNHVRVVSSVRLALRELARGPRYKELYDGDGLARLVRGSVPGVPEWTEERISDNVFWVRANLDDFVPCPNGETIPDIRPCLAPPPPSDSGSAGSR